VEPNALDKASVENSGGGLDEPPVPGPAMVQPAAPTSPVPQTAPMETEKITQ
jgi:hypothetical protein